MKIYFKIFGCCFRLDVYNEAKRKAKIIAECKKIIDQSVARRNKILANLSAEVSNRPGCNNSEKCEE